MFKFKRKNLIFQNNDEKGFSLIELIIVVLIVCVLAAIAIPELVNSRRLIRASQVPRTIFTELRFARQQAMSQQSPISFVYDHNDAAKNIRIYGGSYGVSGNARNKVTLLAGNGLQPNDIGYGFVDGCSAGALSDSTTLTELTNNKIVITFRPDGTIINPSGTAASYSDDYRNYALYIYNSNYPEETSTAISVLGASGRTRLWRCNTSGGSYQ